MNNKIAFYLNEADLALNDKLTVPVTCEIDLTTICQNSCRFCINKESNKSSHSIMDINLLYDLGAELNILNVPSITLTGGGEPLVHPQFTEIVCYLKELKFKLGLITNGIFLDRYIDLVPLFEFVRVSLYGVDDQSYYDITGTHNFQRVINNICEIVKVKSTTTVGISYAIEENFTRTDEAAKLASVLDVDYIQFKPVLNNKFDCVSHSSKTIITERYNVLDTRPCKLAGLIGIVSADGNVYYCCIKRGIDKYCLGNLRDNKFLELWAKRKDIVPNISECHSCRYVNYVKGYDSIPKSDFHFLKHRDFL